ncbi:MAG: hypothetical protein COB12_10030 [Flavobacterium sp.]|nr:MAG: hypothetical protein COB12_10030 [Flavobacterium sp.]
MKKIILSIFLVSSTLWYCNSMQSHYSTGEFNTFKTVEKNKAITAPTTLINRQYNLIEKLQK